MGVEDCKYHDWIVGASFGDNSMEHGIYVHCKKCGCRRMAKFNKSCFYKEKRRK